MPFEGDEYVVVLDQCRVRGVQTLGMPVHLLLPQRRPTGGRVALRGHDRVLLVLSVSGGQLAPYFRQEYSKK